MTTPEIDAKFAAIRDIVQPAEGEGIVEAVQRLKSERDCLQTELAIAIESGKRTKDEPGDEKELHHRHPKK